MSDDNLDRLANTIKGEKGSPGESYHSDRLDDLPEAQWPTYIDESAFDVVTGEGDPDRYGLVGDKFSKELNEYYETGMSAIGTENSDIPVIADRLPEAELVETVEDLTEMYLNAVRNYDIEEFGSIAEAAINTVLASEVGRFKPVNLPDNEIMTAEVMVQLFSDPMVAQSADRVVKRLNSVVDQDFFDTLDEPRMMLPLSDDHREAIKAWLDVSGKVSKAHIETFENLVFGLAVIAHRYGGLHHNDLDISDGSGDTGDVLVVTHSSTRLNRWKLGLDEYLSIPRERIRQGSIRKGNDVSLRWGSIHFRTVQQILGIDTRDYDLVILDETDEWDSDHLEKSVEKFDTDLVALSRPIKSDVKDVIKETGATELGSFSPDGEVEAGFEWNVIYTTFESGDDQLSKITQNAEKGFESFNQRADDIVEMSRAGGSSNFNTYQDFRNFSFSEDGLLVKRRNNEFRNFVTALFSRRAKIWNETPKINTVTDVVEKHGGSKKSLVLLNNNREVIKAEERLEKLSVTNVISIKQEKVDQRLENFRKLDEGVLVTTDRIFVENSEIPKTDIVVNSTSFAGLRNRMIRKIKASLRSEGKSRLYHVVGIPSKNSEISKEDGVELLENAAAMITMAEDMNASLRFDSSSNKASRKVSRMRKSGVERIENLVGHDKYDWPDQEGQKQTEVLKDLIDFAESDDLTEWKTEPEPEETKTSEEDESEESDEAEEEIETPTRSRSRRRTPEMVKEVQRGDVEDEDVKNIVELLDSSKIEQKRNAVHALSYISEDHPEKFKPVTKKLTKLLEDEDEDVRKYASRCLGFVGDRSVIDKIEKAEADPRPSVRVEAKGAKKRIESRIEEEEEEGESEPEKEESEEEEEGESEPEKEESEEEEEKSKKGEEDEAEKAEEETEEEAKEEAEGEAEKEGKREVEEEGEETEEETKDEAEQEVEDEKEDEEKKVGETVETPRSSDSEEDEKSSQPKKKTQKSTGSVGSDTVKLESGDEVTGFGEVVLMNMLNQEGSDGHATKAVHSVIRDYPGAVDTVAPRYLQLLKSEDEEMRRYASLMVKEISDSQIDKLENGVWAVIDLLKEDDEGVRQNAKHSLVNMARDDPENFVDALSERVREGNLY